MPYRVATDAERDLDDIFSYWAKRAGLEIADRLLDSIMDRFWILGQHPEAGRLSSEIAPGVRCFPAGKYLIYYRKSRAGTDILHVFHGAQDQKKAFQSAKRHRRKLGP